VSSMRPRSDPKRRSRLFRAFERAVLGFGMTIVAFFIERRLIKAIKKGQVEAAPRTAAGGQEAEGVLPPAEGELSTSAHQVGHQPHG
jgi:hypothetical protein